MAFRTLKTFNPLPTMKNMGVFNNVMVLAIGLVTSGQSLLAAGGGNSSYITIAKQEQFDQISANAPVADPTSPFVFNSGSPVAMSFTPPGGTSTALTLAQGSNKYNYDESFATLAAMNAAYPDGNYTFAVSGASSFTLSLSGDLYPNIPQVMGGTWNSSGQLVVDSTQNNTLNFNTFTTYGTAGAISHMQLSISSADQSTVSISQAYLTPTNPSVFTSYSIPAGTLTPGSIYFCSLEFDTVPADNATAVSGDTAVTIYTTNTNFVLVTSGTPSGAPTITQQPSNQTAPIGSNVSFTVEFSGNNNVLVQWFKNGIPINLANGGNGNGPTLMLSNIQNSDAASYYAILSNGNGSYVQSNTVTLAIGASTSSSPPSFTVEPASQTVATGSTVAFNAFASGSPSYQWQFNGAPLSNGGDISGATGPTLVISGASASSEGGYACVASNSAGSVQSNVASLQVSSTTNIGRLINISCRAQVGTGGNILIAGFAVGGAGTAGSESLLIRGSGPALVPFGVTGTLPDPQLELYSGTTLLGTNDGWGGNSQIASTAATVGAFGWGSTTSHDAALLENLSAGPYTAQIAGQAGDTGVALAEVYDATPAGSYSPTTPRLVNISARVQVGTGGNILIAGFVIGGSTSRTVLIRASGPALVPFGVAGTLPDPVLSLYSGTTLLGSNSGWGGNSEISAAAAQVGAFGWSSPTSNDSAILATLPPGSYTAQVAGGSNDTGVALVEVYEVP
jgi:hypothetical protein